MSHKDWALIWCDSGSYKKQKKHQEFAHSGDRSCEDIEKTQTRQHLGLGLQALRIVRKYISIV